MQTGARALNHGRLAKRIMQCLQEHGAPLGILLAPASDVPLEVPFADEVRRRMLPIVSRRVSFRSRKALGSHRTVTAPISAAAQMC